MRRALQAHFDASTLAKGRVYQQQQRVLECTVGLGAEGGWVIAAEVRGSRSKPYEVNVDLFDLEGALTIEGDCSCPMEFDCKHVAAALLHVAGHPEL
ncbi:MAG TPA: SWIM zinc finger family protein, partial [Gemmataceae bacterium]|nr:SWIM zinc finger family protein [Gemmataceae bacterium]